jgi:hypothetical protein
MCLATLLLLRGMPPRRAIHAGLHASVRPSIHVRSALPQHLSFRTRFASVHVKQLFHLQHLHAAASGSCKLMHGSRQTQSAAAPLLPRSHDGSDAELTHDFVALVRRQIACATRQLQRPHVRDDVVTGVSHYRADLATGHASWQNFPGKLSRKKAADDIVDVILFEALARAIPHVSPGVYETNSDSNLCQHYHTKSPEQQINVPELGTCFLRASRK